MATEASTPVPSEPLDPFAQSLHHQGDLAKLQSLLSRGRVEEARHFVRELQARWPDSDLVCRFARVLAPPVARVVEGRKGMSRQQTETEGAWLREHAREYPGCWVILDGDRLIAANPSLRAAIHEADRHVGREVGSLYYIRPETDGE